MTPRPHCSGGVWLRGFWLRQLGGEQAAGSPHRRRPPVRPKQVLADAGWIVFFSLIQYLHRRNSHSKLLYDGIIDNVQTEEEKDMKLQYPILGPQQVSKVMRSKSILNDFTPSNPRKHHDAVCNYDMYVCKGHTKQGEHPMWQSTFT